MQKSTVSTQSNTVLSFSGPYQPREAPCIGVPLFQNHVANEKTMAAKQSESFLDLLKKSEEKLRSAHLRYRFCSEDVKQLNKYSTEHTRQNSLKQYGSALYELHYYQSEVKYYKNCIEKNGYFNQFEKEATIAKEMASRHSDREKKLKAAMKKSASDIDLCNIQ